MKLDETHVHQLAENLKRARRDLKETIWRTYKNLMLLGKQSNGKQTGTEVVISNIDKNFTSLTDDKAPQEIANYFAVYLMEYPGITIDYNGTIVDPKSAHDRYDTLSLGDITLSDGKTAAADLTVIEWKQPQERALHLCDARGISLHQVSPAIHAPGFNFTAYLKSDHIRELDKHGLLTLEELHPDVTTLINAAKGKLKEHFRKRAVENTGALLQEWKADKIYPYEGDPKDKVEEAERQVFDVVAVNIEETLNQVLDKYRVDILKPLADDAPVTLEDGTTGRIDLMLARSVPQPRANEREHLVVELKRPAKKICTLILGQVKNYAIAVARDERFRDTKTKWIFWAVSNEMTEEARRESRQRRRPEGLVFDDEELRITVWAKTWGQIINDCKGRLNFFKEKLDYEANHDSARVPSSPTPRWAQISFWRGLFWNEGIGRASARCGGMFPGTSTLRLRFGSKTARCA
ncbi:MAG TPA: hypothetical protein VH595_22375 [Verrucomicrobiae bacterium]|nr:hypothetical protein [Verrucomicrobiae bacterium]